MKSDAERTPAAERMARLRQRRRKGLRSITVAIRETEIDALIARGLLASEMRESSGAIAYAVGLLLDVVFRSPRR